MNKKDGSGGFAANTCLKPATGTVPLVGYSKMVTSFTFVPKASIAFLTNSYLSSFSASQAKAGLPTGWGMATVGTILLAPTDCEIVVMVAIWTIGIPYLSISFTIVAPQRVQVPQVDVRITPSTPAFFNSAPISLPNLTALLTEVPVPVVV